MSEAHDDGKRDLVEGAFYWVLIVLDPDAMEPWENRPMPARYAGDGKWHFMGEEGVSDWGVRWVGDRIVEESAKPTHRHDALGDVREVLLQAERDQSWVCANCSNLDGFPSAHSDIVLENIQSALAKLDTLLLERNPK